MHHTCLQPLFAYPAFCGTRSSLVVHAMSDFTVDDEIRMMELELALLKKEAGAGNGRAVQRQQSQPW